MDDDEHRQRVPAALRCELRRLGFAALFFVFALGAVALLFSAGLYH